jgi:hypothetical protein
MLFLRAFKERSAGIFRYSSGRRDRRHSDRSNLDRGNRGAASSGSSSFRQLPVRSHEVQQLAIVANILKTSLDRAEMAIRVQAEAGSKLDAAEYALHRMLDEISSVMNAPLQRAALASAPRLPRLPTSLPALAA